MQSASNRARVNPRRREPAGYAFLSTRPLHILAFLTPLIVLYEVGSAFYLTDPSGHAIETIRAHKLFFGFFNLFDVGSLFLPGALLVAVLLLWHILVSDRWRVSVPVLPAMLAESAAWTIPLVVLAQIVATTLPEAPSLASAALALVADAGGAPAGGATPVAPDLRSPAAMLTISIGAGIYEEMLFRLLGIALLHFIAADLLRMGKAPAAIVAVVGAAIAFALYHVTPGAPIVWPHLVFQFLAGLYFGGVYAWRGFGIVVATHALYDVIALVLQ